MAESAHGMRELGHTLEHTLPIRDPINQINVRPLVPKTDPSHSVRSTASSTGDNARGPDTRPSLRPLLERNKCWCQTPDAISAGRREQELVGTPYPRGDAVKRQLVEIV
jgi:hypothetical protein